MANNHKQKSFWASHHTSIAIGAFLLVAAAAAVQRLFATSVVAEPAAGDAVDAVVAPAAVVAPVSAYWFYNDDSHPARMPVTQDDLEALLKRVDTDLTRVKFPSVDPEWDSVNRSHFFFEDKDLHEFQVVGRCNNTVALQPVNQYRREIWMMPVDMVIQDLRSQSGVVYLWQRYSVRRNKLLKEFSGYWSVMQPTSDLPLAALRI